MQNFGMNMTDATVVTLPTTMPGTAKTFSRGCYDWDYRATTASVSHKLPPVRHQSRTRKKLFDNLNKFIPKD